MAKSWPPDYRLPDYDGPYPKYQLEAARRTLIERLTSPHLGTIIERVKPRIGISSSYGQGQKPPPIRWPPSDVQTPPPASGFRPLMESKYETLQIKAAMPAKDQQLSTTGLSHPHATPLTSVASLYGPTSSGNISLTSVDSGYIDNDGCTVLDDSSSSLMADDSQFFSEGRNHQSHGISPASCTVTSQTEAEGGAWSAVNSPELNQVSSPYQNIARPNHSLMFQIAQVANNRTPMSPTIPSIFDSPFEYRYNPAVHSLKRSFVADTQVDAKRQKSLICSDPSPAGVLVENTYKTYKCDFCQFRCTTGPQMQIHLVNAKHFSGSLYNAGKTSNGHKLLSIEQMLAVKNNFCKTTTLVAICPDCCEIFEDIFMCAMHHKYLHPGAGSTNGCYAVCPVIRHETITFSLEATCNICKVVFPKQKLLHKHWNEFPTHHPIKLPKNSKSLVLYICPYCSKIFYDNFLNCKTHVLDHGKNSVAKESFAMELKEVMKPTGKEELPPFNTTEGHQNGLKHELTILTNMHSFYSKDISGAKAKAGRLTERIKYLKQLL